MRLPRLLGTQKLEQSPKATTRNSLLMAVSQMMGLVPYERGGDG